MHQALHNLCRYLLDDTERLDSLASVAVCEMRQFVIEVIDRKRYLRRLSRQFGQLQQQVLRSTKGSSPDAQLAAAYRDAALGNMRKRWNVAFHEWCVQAIEYYYLLDTELRERWLHGSCGDRPRVTVISEALRQAAPGTNRHQVAQDLPTRLKLLDLGSCANYFVRHSTFDVTALDLAPAEGSVLQCDVLKLKIGPAGSKPVMEGSHLHQLPAQGFQVAVLALLLSYMPDPNSRANVIAKVRRLLPTDHSGLLIIADTVPSIGRHSEGLPEWVSNVEAAGYRLLQDPQMHFSKKRDVRTGVVNRAACFSFATAEVSGESKAEPLPGLRLLQDDKSNQKA